MGGGNEFQAGAYVLIDGTSLSGTFAKLKMPATYQSETVMVYEPSRHTRDTRELSTLAGILTLPGTLSVVRTRLGLEERGIGGLGIHIVRNLVDDVEDAVGRRDRGL